MNKLVEQLERDVTNRLIAEFAPERIILFGSHAWGSPNENSDIDLYLVVSKSDQAPIHSATRAYRALRGGLAPLDILVRTRAEMQKAIQVLASLDSEVIESGRVLY